MAKVYWRMSSDTHKRYLELSNEMMNAARENDQMRFDAAKEAFQALPDFPPGIHEDLDLVVPQIDDTMGRIVTFGRG